MTAHVGDFGLARFLINTANKQPETQTLSSALKGSIGYIPPEFLHLGTCTAMGYYCWKCLQERGQLMKCSKMV
ncbi:non-specific serine/threonine protein kinase [Ranunculus cassubicifolius]